MAMHMLRLLISLLIVNSMLTICSSLPHQNQPLFAVDAPPPAWSNFTQQAKLMRRCIELAKLAPFPFGALAADPRTGLILAEGKNHVDDGNPIWHGEISTITQLAAELNASGGGPSVLDVAPTLELYTTAEPCPMCAGAIAWSGFGRVIFGTSIEFIANEKFLPQITVTAESIITQANFTNTTVIGGVLRNETDLLYMKKPNETSKA